MGTAEPPRLLAALQPAAAGRDHRHRPPPPPTPPRRSPAADGALGSRLSCLRRASIRLFDPFFVPFHFAY